MNIDRESSRQAIDDYLAAPKGKRLHIDGDKLVCSKYDKVHIFTRILAKLFGAGNASFKNVIKFAEKCQLTEKQIEELHLKVTNYNKTHAIFKRAIGSVKEALPAAIAPAKPAQQTATPVQATKPDSPKMHTFSEVSIKDWLAVSKETDRVRIQFPSSEAFLTLAKGNVTEKQGVDVAAAMNAANDTMYHGGRGTNAAFSKSIPEAHWKMHQKKLAVSDCGEMPWPETAVKKEHEIAPKYLFHVLGPVVNDITKLDIHQNEVYQAYKNLFAACKAHKLDSIQMTGLSTGIFCSLKEADKPKWFKMVDEAMFLAMNEAVRDGSIKEIVLVDFSVQPWNTYLLD